MAESKSPRDPAKERRIIAAAMHIFAKQGYQNAKTDDIATAAKVSKGLIFHYYGSKAKLYLESVKAAYAKLNATADFSVWQDAADLKQMITRALTYKIQLQFDYPDEFGIALAAYSDVSSLPSSLQKELTQVWSSELNNSVPDLTGPIIKRMQLRPGVKPETVQKMITAMSMLISEEAKGLFKDSKELKADAMAGVVAEANECFDMLEHGFLAE
ncbi:TetR/AcrR family transcriptional regulator [Lacticaseibacillus zhaodongensis]|uniref:TetR/AcrR family transcriptional regulator n=1 Tax=Lacticaseibacillus zhaodongensis TaxID=2668065 RepID=UPI0018B00A5B|nr:TetR/AcrR family transcriptional regulator [Lacticaseibacillus zhaodongensis]